jgi:hypothetical protein
LNVELEPFGTHILLHAGQVPQKPEEHRKPGRHERRKFFWDGLSDISNEFSPGPGYKTSRDRSFERGWMWADSRKHPAFFVLSIRQQNTAFAPHPFPGFF